MSADNYYIIRKDQKTGQFVPVMGFASDDYEAVIRDNDKRYDTIGEALDYADRQYAEYGVQIHDECNVVTIRSVNPAEKAAAVLSSHYLPGEGYIACNCGAPLLGSDVRSALAQHQSELVIAEMSR